MFSQVKWMSTMGNRCRGATTNRRLPTIIHKNQAPWRGFILAISVIVLKAEASKLA